VFLVRQSEQLTERHKGVVLTLRMEKESGKFYRHTKKQRRMKWENS